MASLRTHHKRRHPKLNINRLVNAALKQAMLKATYLEIADIADKLTGRIEREYSDRVNGPQEVLVGRILARVAREKAASL